MRKMGTQTTCDRCGRVIDPPVRGLRRLLHERHRIDPIFMPEMKRTVPWDICEECGASFMEWFAHPERDRNAGGDGD